MAVTKRTRFEVLKRDGHACRYCGGKAPDVELTVDHVIPTALGGTDDPSNLVAACVDCNAGKSSTAPAAELVADVKAADLAWAGAIKRAAEIMASERQARDAYTLAFLEVWQKYGKTPQWNEATINRLYEAGLPVDEMKEAAQVASIARGVLDRFAYFAGIAWKKVAALQETAKQLLEAGGE